ncbi:P2Y purinoceptor 6-like [Conger conger]|uniref:P2Y purinoceptor 6-like n=1 Tax=Conger conger TaxID=82655 RepID=UPI002A59E54E|nr:P2Y purinoceptor 6-like [Conger conger]
MSDMLSVLPEVYWIYLCALMSNMLLGLPTNSWVLWLIAKGSRDTLSSEIFTFNLAALELTYCLQIPLSFLNYFLWKQRFIRLFTFFNALIIFGRPLFLCCICIERYLAVLHPLTFLRCKPLRYRLGCLGLAWMGTIAGCSFCVFLDADVLNYVILAVMLVILSIKCFCCLAVLQALRRPGPGEGAPGQSRGGGPQLAKQKAFRIILFNLIFNLVDYLPMTVAILLRSLMSERVFRLFRAISSSIAVFGAFIQPVHFLFRAGKLQCIVGNTC